jgi:hypothetical protein
MNTQQSAVSDCGWSVRARFTEVSPAATSADAGDPAVSSVSDPCGFDEFCGMHK